MISQMSQSLNLALLALTLISGYVNGASLPTHQLSERQSSEGSYGGTNVQVFYKFEVKAKKGQAYQNVQVTDNIECNKD